MRASVSELFRKYDVPAPRYTSYPTVPYWSETPSSDEWMDALRRGLNGDTATWSIYVHLPFCETLCTFCGCNNTITRNHDREAPYVDLVLKEMELYHAAIPEFGRRPLRQLHLGGGTPTFFSADQLRRLVEGLLRGTRRDLQHFEGSLEVDPRRTRIDQLEALRQLGFQRLSLGVQDFDPTVQYLVNRVQSFESTLALTQAARELGYESINFDLIYGLPRQTRETMTATIEKTIAIGPDRIALYSFAKVPWIKPAQRLFSDADLPEGPAKLELYEIARAALLEAGYVEIGLDHFSLPREALALSAEAGNLHRNFMGYTDQKTDVLLGLGVSAISEAPDCFHQNEKVLPVYEQRLGKSEIPTLRGHRLNNEDLRRRRQILQFMTRFVVDLEDEAQRSDIESHLRSLIDDGLVRLEGLRLVSTPDGRPFLRHACMALDARLRRSQPTQPLFSRTI